MAKKITLFFIVLALILTGCKGRTATSNDISVTVTNTSQTLGEEGSDKTPAPSEATLVSDEKDSVDISMYAELEPGKSNLDTYRKEVARRQQLSSFLTEDEEKLLQETGFRCLGSVLADWDIGASTYKYYYPVVYRWGDRLVLWYTSEGGRISYRKLRGQSYSYTSIYGGYLHYDYPEGENFEILDNNPRWTITYTANEAVVKVWSFGETVETCNVPQGSEYVGNPFFDGYLFRCGTDVYSVQEDAEGHLETVCIAHGVRYVISAHYSASSDAWDSPLFLMENGELLTYVGWDSLGEEPDNPNHLVPLQYEGGYHK